MNELWLLAGGIVLGLLAVWGATRFFPGMGLLDFPERYGLKRSRFPYPGGVVFWLLGAAFFFFVVSWTVVGIALLLLGTLSFLDDREPIPAPLRLVVHGLLALTIALAGIRIGFVGNPFFPGASFDLMSLPWISLFLTVIWIVVIQNAMNWFDGLPGLGVGVSGIGFLALGIFGLLRPEVAWEAGLPAFLQATFFLAGLCAGAFFLFWRGRIILGDTGSQVLGFLLAVLSISAGTKIATTLLVLGLPILDSIFVVARRVFWEKTSPFHGDQKHLHHHLARRIGERRTTLLLIFFSGILGVIAIALTGLVKVSVLFLVILTVWAMDAWASRAGKTP